MNISRLAFLSKPALIPIIAHEVEHIKQAMKNSRRFLLSIIDDKLSFEIEKEAEEILENFPECEIEEALESVLYCYDKWGWDSALKMAKDLYNRDKKYGGGYRKALGFKEYRAFLEAKKAQDIRKFVKAFS